MAAEESCELPPSDFHLTSSLDNSSSGDINGAIRVAIERCTLCGSSRRAFFCKKCVNEGSFTHTRDPSNDRGRDKLARWMILKRERSRLLSQLSTDSAKKVSYDTKKAQIAEAKERLESLKNGVASQQSGLLKYQDSITKLKESNRVRASKAQKHREKKDHIKRYIDKSSKYTASKLVEVQAIQQELVVKKREHLRNLQEFIFPVMEVQPRSDVDVMQQSMVSALAEARHTAYVRGRWIYTDNSGELHYRIIEPSLPGNGDYSSSAYNIWLMETKAEEPEFEPSQRNPLFNICAALSYTTQMLSLLGFFLDINLPHKLCYSHFYQELNERQFRRAITKLNHNVLHACFTQDVPQEHLHPRHTIRNLLLLLDSPNLGRTGSFMSNSDLIRSIEEVRHDVEVSSSSSSEEEEVDHGYLPMSEWEHVPVTLPEPASDASYFVSTQVSRMDQGSTSLAGGIMNSAAASVASLWRYTTGKSDK